MAHLATAQQAKLGRDPRGRAGHGLPVGGRGKAMAVDPVSGLIPTVFDNLAAISHLLSWLTPKGERS